MKGDIIFKLDKKQLLKSLGSFSAAWIELPAGAAQVDPDANPRGAGGSPEGKTTWRPQ